MVLKEKIASIIVENSTNHTSNQNRDILIVQTYFGLGSIQTPTLEVVAEEFGIGTRERVRQIIKEKFIDNLDIQKFEEILKIVTICKSNDFHVVNELLKSLVDEGLVESGVSIKGVLNLLHTLNQVLDYDIYLSSLVEAKSKDIENSENLYLISKEKKKELDKVLKKVKTLPGMRGMCNIYDIFEKLEFDIYNLNIIIELITKQKNSWILNKTDKELWYLLEDRDNIIVNTLEKIVNLGNNIRIDILSKVIYFCIKKRSFKEETPPIEVIEDYIYNSKYIDISNDYAFIKVDKKKLNDIEKRILDYYKNRETKILTYVELKEYLESYNYNKAYIDKSLYHSPFIYVNKDKGRKNFEFILLNYYSTTKMEQENEYNKIKNRLKQLYGETDITSQAVARREQRILRDWLFGKKDTEKCAICGKEYNTSALIAAHKKKRSICSESERTDPNIVMPLCLFGCDYLYEKEYIEIINGSINIIIDDSLTMAEIEYLKSINNKGLEERWTEGRISYFRKSYLRK